MQSQFLRPGLLVLVALFSMCGLFGCTTDDPGSAAAGPGVENPAAAAPNSIIPAVGTAGNGGGVSGGGAGAGGGR